LSKIDPTVQKMSALLQPLLHKFFATKTSAWLRMLFMDSPNAF